MGEPMPRVISMEYLTQPRAKAAEGKGIPEMSALGDWRVECALCCSLIEVRKEG